MLELESLNHEKRKNLELTDTDNDYPVDSLCESESEASQSLDLVLAFPGPIDLGGILMLVLKGSGAGPGPAGTKATVSDSETKTQNTTSSSSGSGNADNSANNPNRPKEAGPKKRTFYNYSAKAMRRAHQEQHTSTRINPDKLKNWRKKHLNKKGLYSSSDSLEESPSGGTTSSDE